MTVSEPEPERWVYFIQEDEDGPIKVGSSLGPEVRMLLFQTGNSHLLRLLGVCAGGGDREIALQAELAGDRKRGEWFWPTARVLDTVAKCLAEDPGAWERAQYERDMIQPWQLTGEFASKAEFEEYWVQARVEAQEMRRKLEAEQWNPDSV